MIEIKAKETIARIKPMIAVYLIVFSSGFFPSNMGKRAKNETIIKKNPISSNTMKMP